jgi:parallel beta-helix repeat protein
LTWSAATDPSTPITYNIYWATTSGGQNFSTPNATSSSDTGDTVSGLINDQIYYFVVRAEDSYGNEDTNFEEFWATPDFSDTNPPVFGGLTSATDAISYGRVILTWNAATDASPPILYNIYWSTTSGGQNFGSPNASTSNSAGETIGDLTNGVEYFFVVRAEDNAAPASNEDTNTVEFSATPTAPTAALYVDSASSTKCSSTFTDHNSWATAAPDISCIVGNKSITTGNTVIVRARGSGKGNSYGGFTMADGVTVIAETSAAYPVVEGNVTFADGTTSPGSVLDGVEILNGGASIYMSAKSATGINNNAIVRNCLITGGVKPGIKHEGGAPIIENNEFTNKDRTGIRWTGPAGTSSEAMIVRGNNFHANGVSGGGTKMYAELHFEKSSDARYVLIQDNLLHDNTVSGGISFDESGDDTVYITGNEIYNNPYAGIHIGTYNDGSGTTHTGRITISGEEEFTFGGVSYSASNNPGKPNKIYSNGRGGVTTGVGVTMDIIKNEIFNNGWGGIHTGFEEPVSGEYTWPSAYGSAVLTIRKNKIYGNGAGTDDAGGGIDVMYASGTIANNVVYENKYSGIRVGDGHLTEISHNTVADNGGGSTPERPIVGGGIVYHDGYAGDGTTPCYYCRPHGTIPWNIDVTDNVIAYTAKAALRGMGFTSTGERDYNLLYANNMDPGGWVTSPDCSTSTWRCYLAQYGFYATGPLLNDLFDDPVFLNRADDDYYLDSSSPGIGWASDGTEMGAWGGTGTYSTPYGTYNVPMDW